MDEILQLLFALLLGGARRPGWRSPKGAARRLRKFNAGEWQHVPILLRLKEGDGSKEVRQQFEIRVMADHPEMLLPGWWDERRIGPLEEIFGELTGSSAVASRVGESEERSISLKSGGILNVAACPDDWQILRATFSK